MLKENDDIKLIPVNVICPPAAITDSEVAVVWDKPEMWKTIREYEIYVDNGIVGTTDKTGFTIRGLDSNASYTITVRAITMDRELSDRSNSVAVTTKPKAKIIDITSFGAVGDGVTFNTVAIQRAIDECPEGGKVAIPQGVFLSGA
ncbi:MAG: glycoside hydrolase family 28 protein, partial [Lachnospiraceae bacterium]|nr:glycoside hydrolase family 28 protein [Lachnospiraceae bacterium]